MTYAINPIDRDKRITSKNIVKDKQNRNIYKG